MADRNLEVALRVKAAIEGLGEVAKLAEEIEGLGGDASKVREQAAALATELEKLTRQKVVAETFKETSAAAAETAAELGKVQASAAEAAARQQTLQQSLALSSAALQTTREQISELSAESSRNSIRLKESEARLADVASASSAATEASRALTAQQAAARNEVTQGERALAASGAELRKAETATQGLERSLQKAKDAQRDLTGQVIAAEQPSAALIDRHTKATEKVSGLERALQDARNKSSAASAEYARQAAALDSLETAYRDAAAASAQADRASEQLKSELQESRAAFDQARASVAATTAALKEAEQAERQLERAANADEKALAAQAIVVDRLRGEVSKAEKAFEEQTAALELARKAMQYAGVDATKLAEEEKRIQRETALAKTKVVELSTELKNHRAALQESAAAAEDKGKKVGILGRILATFRGEASSSTDQTGLFSGALGKLGGMFGPLIAGFAGLQGARRLLTDILTTGSEFERFQKQLEGAFGGAAKGQAAFDWVQKFAKETPLQLQDTLDAVVKLKSFGLDPLDGTLQALVDQNERLGGGQERLNGLVLAVGQAWAKQKLQGEEVLQLVERGVPVYDLLQKALGKTTAEILDMQQKGLLGRDAIKALITEIGNSAAGAAAAQMSTFNGTVSNLKDNYAQFLNQIAQAGVLDTFKREIASISAGMGDASDTAIRIAGGIRLVFESLVVAGATLRSTWNVATSLIKLGAAEIADALALIARFQAKVTFGDMSRGFDEAATSLQNRARELRESAGADLDDIASAGDNLKRSVKGAGEASVQAFAGIPPAAAAASTAMDGTATAAAEAAAALRDRLAPGAATAVKALTEIIDKGDGAKAAIEKVLGAITVTSPQALIDIAAALQSVEASGKATAQEIEDGLAAGLRQVSDRDMPRLLATARDVLGTINKDTADGAARFEQMSGIVDRVRTETFARLGVDADKVLSGVDAKARVLLDTFKALVSDPAANPKLLKTAYDELFKTLGSRQELESLRAALKGVQIQGFDTSKAIGDIDARLRQLPAAEQAYVNGITLVSEAMKKLLAQADERVLKERAAAEERKQRLADELKDNTEAAQTLRTAIGGAQTREELEQIRAALNQAFSEGVIDAQEYEAQLRLINEQSRQLKETFIDLYSVTRNWATDFIGKLSEVALASYRSNVGIKDATLLATDSIEGMKSSIDTLTTWIVENGRVTDSWWRGLAQLANQGFEVARSTLEQKIALEQLIGQFETGTGAVGSYALGTDGATLSLSEFIATAQAARSQMTLLGNADLSRLDQAIESARQRLEALRDGARSALDSVTDELDRLQGKEDEIAMRREERDLQELRDQLVEAQKAQDAEAISDLERAIEKQQEIIRLTQQQIELNRKERAEQDAVQQNTASRPGAGQSAQPNGSREVTLNIPGFGRVTGTFTPAQEASIDALIEALERGRSTST